MYVLAGESVGIGAAMYGTSPLKPGGVAFGLGNGDGAEVYAPMGTAKPEFEVIVTTAFPYKPNGEPAKTSMPTLVETLVLPDGGYERNRNGGGTGGGGPHVGDAFGNAGKEPPHAATAAQVIAAKMSFA